MNFHSDEFLVNAVKERHFQIADLEDFSDVPVVYTYYKGSGNYNLDIEDSDIDTISIILPSIDDIVRNKMVRKEINFDNGIGVVVDIRDFVPKLLKHSRNEMEMLYSKYFYNPTFSQEFAWLKEKASLIENNRKISSFYVSTAIARTFEKKFLGSLSCDEQYNKKALANFIREVSFCMNLIEGKSYQECMTSNDVVICGIKKGYLSESGARETFKIYQNLLTCVEKQEIPEEWKEKSSEADVICNEFLKNCLLKYFHKFPL